MAAEYEILESKSKTGSVVAFGPIDPDTKWQLKMPRSFTRAIRYPELGIEAQLDFIFNGKRVVIESLIINSKPEPVTSRALTQLCLPEITYELTKKLVIESDRWELANKQNRLRIGKINPKSEFVAQLYWLEYVAGGKPRLTVMEYLGAPRPTVNDWLRDLKKYGLLPD